MKPNRKPFMYSEFQYLGKTFLPVGTLVLRDFRYVARHCRSIGISNCHGSKWNYHEFYQKAKEAGAEDIEVFMLEGRKIVLPCEKELSEFSGQYEKCQNLKKPFIATVHLLCEAEDESEAQEIISQCLTENGYGLVRDWAYAKEPYGEFTTPEELPGLELADYEEGEAFNGVSCYIKRNLIP